MSATALLEALAPGALLALLGLAQALLWFASRRDVEMWQRNVNAFATLTSRRFAEGYAGGAIVNAFGLVVGGVGNALAGWIKVRYTEQNLAVPEIISGKALYIMASVIVFFVASIIVSYAKKPEILFPHRMRTGPCS